MKADSRLIRKESKKQKEKDNQYELENITN